MGRRILDFAFAASMLLAPMPVHARDDCQDSPPRDPTLRPIVVDRSFFIYFDWDSAAIAPQAASILENVASVYSDQPRCIIVVAGHADRSGPAGSNLALSRRRAEAVADWLRRRGVRTRLRIEFHGEARPLVETPDGVHEPQNRRAEILVVPSGTP
jgi:outer membrane protein OmpA-like peptidoglycan-associated protein